MRLPKLFLVVSSAFLLGGAMAQITVNPSGRDTLITNASVNGKGSFTREDRGMRDVGGVAIKLFGSGKFEATWYSSGRHHVKGTYSRAGNDANLRVNEYNNSPASGRGVVTLIDGGRTFQLININGDFTYNRYRPALNFGLQFKSNELPNGVPGFHRRGTNIPVNWELNSATKGSGTWIWQGTSKKISIVNFVLQRNGDMMMTVTGGPKDKKSFLGKWRKSGAGSISFRITGMPGGVYASGGGTMDVADNLRKIDRVSMQGQVQGASFSLSFANKSGGK